MVLSSFPPASSSLALLPVSHFFWTDCLLPLPYCIGACWADPASLEEDVVARWNTLFHTKSPYKCFYPQIWCKQPDQQWEEVSRRRCFKLSLTWYEEEEVWRLWSAFSCDWLGWTGIWLPFHHLIYFPIYLYILYISPCDWLGWTGIWLPLHHLTSTHSNKM